MTTSARTAGVARSRSPWLLVAAAVALALWALFTGFLVSKAGTDTDEVQWTRLAWLFSSVEAVAFAAAGALFGSSVQRERAEKAEKMAADNLRDATNGRALAATLKADEEAIQHESAVPSDPVRGVSDRGAASSVSRHAAIARSLFPG